MYPKIISQFILSLALVTMAQDKVPSNKEKLEQELKSLENLKNQKLDALENAEATRWNKRYEQNAKTKQFEEHIRSLESNYTRLASELNNRQDDLLKIAGETRELQSSWEELEARETSFKNQIKQDVGKFSDELSSDIPVHLNERTLMLSGISDKAEQAKTSATESMKNMFGYLAYRFDLSISQNLSEASSMIGESDYAVRRLRLGTVFIGEAAREPDVASQVLLKTGALQGKVFAWRDNLAGNFNQTIQTLVKRAQSGEKNVNVVLDVMQNRSFGSGYTADSGKAAVSSFAGWLKSGGLVMYPLMAVAIIGLLLVLERFIILTSRSTNTHRLMKKLDPLVESQNFKGALDLCNKSGYTVNKVLVSILAKAKGSREDAEKAMMERVLKEVPELEKRMTLIAAFGGAAPLLGLLGTVSGMISLFKVITDVGTNDPRILAGGISEALVTTQAGLMIAIPLLILHGYLSDRLDKIQNEISAQSLA